MIPRIIRCVECSWLRERLYDASESITHQNYEDRHAILTENRADPRYQLALRALQEHAETHKEKRT